MENRTTLTDEKLIQACYEWVSSLSKTGGNSWCLSVPVNFNKDPDMLFIEMGKRLSKKRKWISVDDYLPKNFQQVLVFGDYYGKNHMAEFSCCGNWQVNHWSTDRDNFLDMERIEITHWAYIDLEDNPRHATI